MAKIYKFPASKNPPQRQATKEAFRIDYAPAQNCCNTKSYGMICVRCGLCGRQFAGGVLQEGGAER